MSLKSRSVGKYAIPDIGKAWRRQPLAQLSYFYFSEEVEILRMGRQLKSVKYPTRPFFV